MIIFTRIQCRERGCSYKGRLQISLQWTVNGNTHLEDDKTIAEVPIMVKVCTLCKFYIKDHGMVFHPICNTVLIVSQSEICNLSGLSPAELIRRGEEEEVRNHSSSHCDIPSGLHCINVRTCNYFPQLMCLYFCG